MSDSALVTATFSSLNAARSVRERLTQAGFARNSVNIGRDGDGFEVAINTREENRDRAERILTGLPLGSDLRLAGAQALDVFHAKRALALCLAALAGVALFSWVNRR